MKNPFYIKLGLRLRALRRSHDISQESLAETLGVSFQMVQKYEKGTCRIPVEALLTLSRLYKMSLDTMLTNMEPQPSQAHTPRTAAQSQAVIARALGQHVQPVKIEDEDNG